MEYFASNFLFCDHNNLITGNGFSVYTVGYPASGVGLQQSPSSTSATFHISISRSCKPTLPGFDTFFKCRIQKLGLDSRPSVLFDWFDRFILFWCVPLCECFEKAFHSTNPSNVRFFIVVKDQIDWLKYFSVVMKTSRMLNRKITKPKQS